MQYRIYATPKDGAKARAANGAMRMVGEADCKRDALVLTHQIDKKAEAAVVYDYRDGGRGVFRGFHEYKIK